MIQCIDTHVGSRIHQRRLLLGVSEKTLGHVIGCTVVQIKRYELGLDRVNASRLFKLAEALDVHVTYFFEGLKFFPDTHSAEDNAYVFESEATELIASYHLVPSSKRKEVFENAAAKTLKNIDKLN